MRVMVLVKATKDSKKGFSPTPEMYETADFQADIEQQRRLHL